MIPCPFSTVAICMLDIPGAISTNVSARGPAGTISAYPATPATTNTTKKIKGKKCRTKARIHSSNNVSLIP
jgi:hypothetical protein